MDCKVIFARSLEELAKDRSLDDISVSEIVEQSGLGRTSFYNHFIDKYDLANWMHGEIQRETFSKFSDENLSYSYYECSLSCMKAFATMPELYRSALKPDHIYSLKNHLNRVGFENVEDYFTKRGVSFDDRMRYVLKICIIGSNTIVIEWILGKIDMTPEQIADLLVRALPAEFSSYVGRL